MYIHFFTFIVSHHLATTFRVCVLYFSAFTATIHPPQKCNQPQADLDLLCCCSTIFLSQSPETIGRKNQPNEGKGCKYLPTISCHLSSPLFVLLPQLLVFDCFAKSCFTSLNVFLHFACPLCFIVTLCTMYLVNGFSIDFYSSYRSSLNMQCMKIWMGCGLATLFDILWLEALVR